MVKELCNHLMHLAKNSVHDQGIIHNGVAKNHASVLDTVSQESMIVMVDWEIIKCHNSWTDAQGVNIGVLQNGDSVFILLMK